MYKSIAKNCDLLKNTESLLPNLSGKAIIHSTNFLGISRCADDHEPSIDLLHKMQRSQEASICAACDPALTESTLLYVHIFK